MKYPGGMMNVHIKSSGMHTMNEKHTNLKFLHIFYSK